ncbi:DUF3244 domain-containing protein [Thermophagus sp. OGC60D27]|uniref:DUF3244 domain-containing protein n=1 Tax=Thermophagus sp. OGC60D27 TaxID=3458415 RepID=UPI0040378A92
MEKLLKSSLALIFISTFFFSVVSAEEKEKDAVESDKEKVDLLMVRDLELRSFSLSTYTLERASVDQVSIAAYYNDEELTLEVYDYDGPFYVRIGNKYSEVFYVSGGGAFDVDLGDIQSGVYSLEINAGGVRYVGHLNID